MIEIKKGHSLKIVSAVMSIIFLCNSTGYSFNLLRVPFSSYSRIQKVYYTYSKSSLAHIFDFLENIIQPRTAEEISKSSDVNLSPETVRRTLNSLYKLGLIVRGKKDNKIVYSLVPLSPLQRLDIRNILTSSLPHSRPTKAELQKIVPSIKSILRRTDLIKEKRKALAFPPTLSFQDSEPMARDIKALNEQVRIEQLKIQIDTKKTVKLDKSEDCEERVINGYPLEIRPDITHIIAASQIDHRRAKRHALRLLESDRTSVENQFARALFRFYEHRLLGTRTYFKPDLPRYIGTYYVMSFEGYSTTLFWTLAPYLYDRLIKLNIDEKVAFEIICAWVKQVAEKKYYARGRDFYFRNYLIGLDMLRLEEFYLLKESDYPPGIVNIGLAHELADRITEYILCQEEFQNIVSEVMVINEEAKRDKERVARRPDEPIMAYDTMGKTNQSAVLDNNPFVSSDNKKAGEWSVSSLEEPPVFGIITDSHEGWIKEKYLDLNFLPVGTLVYLGDTGQSIGADGIGDGYPIRYIVKIEEGGVIKLWFGDNRGCYVGRTELLGSILFIDGGRQQFTPGQLQARRDIDFPYFKWKGIDLLPLTDRVPNELTWTQRFPFFRVLYPESRLQTHLTSGVRLRDNI